MKGKGIEVKLDELGFRTGSISEVILTTMNPDGTPNAAPMGALRTGPCTLEIRPFKTSNTYRNLLGHKRASVNITTDPGLFLVTAFKEERFEGFGGASFKNDMRLEASDAHVIVEVIGGREVSDDRARFTCKVTSVELCNLIPRAFSRGVAAAIEAIVHATRIEVFTREAEQAEVERLIRRFFECKDVVERVSAPDSTEARVIRELERLIACWRERERR
jgi:hypothetical protein